MAKLWDDNTSNNVQYDSPALRMYNLLTRGGTPGARNENFFARRARSIENALGTTAAALVSAADTAAEDRNIEVRNSRFKQNMNDIYKKYGYNSADDYYNAKDEAEKLFDKYGFNSEDYWQKHADLWSPSTANSDEVKALEKTREDAINRMSQEDADKIRYFENIQNELKGQASSNANEAKKAAEDWKDYRTNSYVGKKINQDRGKFAGSALNTLSTMTDVMLPTAGIALNAVQGGVEGVADELEDNGFKNFDWGRAGQNALVGAVTGGVTGGLNKGLNKIASSSGNLLPSNNVLGKAANAGLNLDRKLLNYTPIKSNNIAGQLVNNVYQGGLRGGLSGGVGGATGAGLSAAMNGQDVLGSVAKGFEQGAKQGVMAGGVMGGANTVLRNTPGVGNAMRQLDQAGENWQKSGNNFNERLTNTLTSGDSGVGNWIQGKQSKLLSSAGQIGDTIRDYTDAGMGPRKAEAAAYEDLLKSYNEERGLQGAIEDARAAGYPNDSNFQKAQRYIEGGSMAITPEDAFNDLKSVYGDSFKESTYKNKDGSWKYRNGEPYVWTTYKNKIAMNLSKAMDAADAGQTNIGGKNWQEGDTFQANDIDQTMKEWKVPYLASEEVDRYLDKIRTGDLQGANSYRQTAEGALKGWATGNSGVYGPAPSQYKDVADDIKAKLDTLYNDRFGRTAQTPTTRNIGQYENVEEFNPDLASALRNAKDLGEQNDLIFAARQKLVDDMRAKGHDTQQDFDFNPEYNFYKSLEMDNVAQQYGFKDFSDATNKYMAANNTNKLPMQDTVENWMRANNSRNQNFNSAQAPTNRIADTDRFERAYKQTKDSLESLYPNREVTDQMVRDEIEKLYFADLNESSEPSTSEAARMAKEFAQTPLWNQAPTTESKFERAYAQTRDSLKNLYPDQEITDKMVRDEIERLSFADLNESSEPSTAEAARLAKEFANTPLQNQTPDTLGGWLKKAGQRVVEDANNRGVGMSIKNVGNEQSPRTNWLSNKINDFRAESDNGFGPRYNQFAGNGDRAIDYLLKRQGGEVEGAVRSPAIESITGDGNVDLVYGKTGKDGYGLAHIIEKHGEGIAREIPNILETGKVVDDPVYTNANRITMVSNDNTGAVRLGWDDNKKQWVVTAYEGLPYSPVSSANTQNGIDASLRGSSVQGLDDTTVNDIVSQNRRNVNAGNEPFLAYGESDLGNRTRRGMIADSLSRLGDTLEGAQADVTRAATRKLGIESTGKVIENVRKKTGLTNLETQAKLAKELTGGENSLMDNVQRRALSASEDGKLYKVDTEPVSRDVEKIVDKYADTNMFGSQTARNKFVSNLRRDIANYDADVLTIANRMKANAADLRGKGIAGVTPSDSAKAKIYSEIADRLDDLSYEAIPKQNVNDMFDATISEMRGRAEQAARTGNKDIAKAYNTLASRLDAEPRTISAYRSFKKDFVDVAKIDKLSGQAENGAAAQMGRGFAGGLKRFTGTLLQRPANAALAKIGGAINAGADRMNGNGGGDVTAPTGKTPFVPEYENPATQLYNAIGRTEGQIQGNQAKYAKYLADNAQEAVTVPNTGANTLEDLASTTVPTTSATSVYNTMTGTQNTQTPQFNSIEEERAVYFYPPTGDYMTDMLSQAMRRASNAKDYKALGQLYEMYVDTLSAAQKRASSSNEQEKLTDTQRRAYAAESSLNELAGMSPDLGYQLSNIPVVGNIATLGGNTYQSAANSLATQIGYMLSGANIKEDEAARIGQSYVPQPFDSEATRQSKLQRAKQIIEQYKNTYTQPTSGVAI